MELKRFEWDYLGWEKIEVYKLMLNDNNYSKEQVQHEWNNKLFDIIDEAFHFLFKNFYYHTKKICFYTIIINVFSKKTYDIISNIDYFLPPWELWDKNIIKLIEGKMHYSVIKIYFKNIPENYVTIDILNF